MSNVRKKKRRKLKNNRYVVYYTNMDNRPDRKVLVEKELDKLFPMYHRMSGSDGSTHTDNSQIIGTVGCGLTHIKCLEHGFKSGAEYVFIFEDDFELELDDKFGLNLIKSIKDKSFNMILLSYHIPVVKLSNISINNLADIKNGQTTCSYVVRKNFIPTLIKTFKESITKLVETGSTDDYAVDQYWKSLQTSENKVYGIVPRLGKQRSDYSDIQKCKVNYGGTCFMGILTCEKYKHKKETQDVSKSVFQYKYFIGDPNLSVAVMDGDTVYLPCGDEYEDLSDKTREMIKWILENNKSVDYIFKTDDDIIFNFENLMELFSSVTTVKSDYAGHVSNSTSGFSEYHLGKCTNKELEVKIPTKKCTYCSGGGYFISKRSAEIIVNNIDTHKNIYEDFSVGLTLNSCNIYPLNINIKDNACMW